MRLFKNQVCFIQMYNSLIVFPHLSLIFLIPLIAPPLLTNSFPISITLYCVPLRLTRDLCVTLGLELSVKSWYSHYFLCNCICLPLPKNLLDAIV